MIHRRAVLAGLGGVGLAGLAGCSTGPGGVSVFGAGAEDAAEARKAAEAKQLTEVGPLGEKSMGRADAPVTVIEYASLTCPFCRAFHAQTLPRFKKAYVDTGKVRYVVREFPIGRSAAAAAIVTRCAPDKQYFAMVDRFLANQSRWTGQKVRPDAIYSVVKPTGMTRQQFDSCLANQKIIDGLMWVKQRGRALGVVGTPTFFINGEKVRGVLTFEQIEAKIAPYLT